MPYSNSKNNDIFISYAHDDDFAGWVKHFGDLLEKKLKQQIKIEEDGREVDVKVFTDASLPPSGALQTRLEDEIMDSALLLVIMSESYLSSKWCKIEGKTFIQNLKGSRELKIFIAEMKKTDRNRWPDYLKDERGGPLLSKEFNMQTNVGKYRPIEIRKSSGEFTQRADDWMEDLCQPIYDELNKQNINLPAHPADISLRVFLALCSSEVGEAAKYMNKLREKLVQLDNIKMLESLNPLDLKNSLSDRFANCDLFIQILDEQKGFDVPNRENGFVGYQYEQAIENGIRIVQWKVPGLASFPTKDDPYHRFLADLKLASAEGGTLLSGDSLDDFFAAIKAALNFEQIPANTGDIQSIRVEIRSLREDRKEAVKVGKAIRDRSYVWNKGKGGETIRIRPVVLYDGANAEDLDLLAKLSKGTVIVYAKNYKWVDYHEEKVSSETNRIGRIAICDPWPKDAEFLALRQIEMFSMANAAGRDAEIDEFLEELANALTINR